MYFVYNLYVTYALRRMKLIVDVIVVRGRWSLKVLVVLVYSGSLYVWNYNVAAVQKSMSNKSAQVNPPPKKKNWICLNGLMPLLSR